MTSAPPTMGCPVGGLELEALGVRPVQAPQGTVVDRLREWSRVQPDKTLYTWLDSKGQETAKWTYRELEMRSNAVCHALLSEWGCQHGDRAALMYLPGLEFIAGFWGCLFVGVIAVPVYPVDLRGEKFALEVARFDRIVAACEPKLVLSHSQYLNMKRLHAVKNMFGSGSWPEGLEFEATDGLGPRADCGTDHVPQSDELAFLQFTSGSTGDPKGVMLSQGNLAHNVHASGTDCGTQPGHLGVSWVPQYHDMGLIGVLLLSCWAGAQAVCMSPTTMLSNPVVWLKACGEYKATQTCGMDGMYSHAVKRITDEQAAALDLSSLTVYLSAGEPVRATVVLSFARKFEAAGLRRGACYPCFGLAENGDPPTAVAMCTILSLIVLFLSAVFVTGRGPELRDLRILELDKNKLEEGTVQPVGSHGPRLAELRG